MSKHPRLIAERARLTQMRLDATPPERCGPDIPVAPARGPMLAFTPRRVEMTEAGPRMRRDGWLGRDAARAADAFDLAQAQSDRRSGSARKVLFTETQIDTGRDYAALVEAVEAGGYSLSQAEGRSGGGKGSAAGVSEAVLDQIARLRAMRAAIPAGAALRPIRTDGGQRVLTHVDLVDMFCCGGKTVAQVLAARGWNPRAPGARAKAMRALVLALDAMATALARPVRRNRLDRS